MNELNETFIIGNDQMAEWAMGKIAEAKAEQERWKAFYEEKLRAIMEDTQNTINYMTGQLQRYFDTQEHRVTKTGIHKYSLPSGELILKPGSIDYKRDEDAMLSWCEKHLPGAVKVTVTRKAGWAEVKQYIKDTGEIPDGVEAYITEPTFQVKEAAKNG